MVAREGGGLGGHAFHQVAIRDDRVNPVVNDPACGGVEARFEHLGGERHAHARGESLAERPGGDFHAGRVAEFGVAGGRAIPLAEVFDIIKRNVEPGEV